MVLTSDGHDLGGGCGFGVGSKSMHDIADVKVEHISSRTAAPFMAIDCSKQSLDGEKIDDVAGLEHTLTTYMDRCLLALGCIPCF